MNRYIRQTLFTPLGPDGQQRLRASCVSIIGVGALGCASATLLVRSGVGRLRLYDRDFVELDNLQRQVLYDEADVASDLPKAQAAARHLAAINSEVALEPFVEDMAMAIVPGSTPCFRCLLPAMPPPGSTPTCDTAGILNAAATLIASFQVGEALKLLSGRMPALSRGIFCADLWEGEFGVSRVKRVLDCPACARKVFEHLDGGAGSRTTSLCGHGAVQVLPAAPGRLDLAALAERLSPLGAVRRNDFLLKFSAEGLDLTVFPDGRIIVKGTEDGARARSLYARYIGT